MGVVETIDFDNFPKQKDDNYKYPSIGKRVRVCYKYDTSRCHEGVIVRDDIGAPGETIIKLDNGRYLRATECQYSIKEEAATFPETNADRIRNMTDEELAGFISSLNDVCLAGIGEVDCSKLKKCDDCVKVTLKCLQSPVEV